MLLKDMNILSIDPALGSSGVCLYLGRAGKRLKILTIKTVKSKKSKGVKTEYSIQERLTIIFNEIHDLLWFCSWDGITDNIEIDLILFEGAILHFKKSSSTVVLDLAQVKGLIRTVAIMYNAPVLEMPIQTWRSWVKAGQYNKNDAEKYCRKIEKVNHLEPGTLSNTDEADAYLMLLALFMIDRSSALFGASIDIKEQLKEIRQDSKLDLSGGSDEN